MLSDLLMGILPVWALIVIGCSVLVVIVLTVILIICCRRCSINRHNERFTQEEMQKLNLESPRY